MAPRILTIITEYSGRRARERGSRQWLRRASVAGTGLFLAACGFDPTSPEYDQRRYTELQRADCREVASLGAKPFISGKSGETYESVLERCKKMQAMTFEQYQAAADRARRSGVWTFDEPETETAPIQDDTIL